ncbi:ATP-dependent DNA helicase DinG [Neobacillus mesonae]|uniref:ATP-dependent DNA helicase DinG n=1 Tax=Neobacillus mesonae TaxID=1193713 RepID=UPI00203E864E|nr:ATP-dependent DNA helicase DinG [Neobacillus mesonae]MCM3566816.1 ATP-dependent DNA helicase DinG [Neobacillus mesonae]
MLNKFVVIDLETTGNIPKKGDKIIQFAAVVVEDGMITEQFSSLINPQKPIPMFIEELTGINDEMVKNAPLFSEIASKVESLLESAYFVAHNVLFDLSFIQEELLQAGYEGFYGSVLDTVELARILYPTADGYKLSDLAEKENLQHDRPHQADSDAEVTAELLLIFLKRLSSLPRITLEQLFPLSGGLKSDLHQLLDEMLETLDEQGQKLSKGIEIFNNLALKKSLSHNVESLEDENYFYPKNNQDKVNILKKGYELFENRTGQLKMMDTVFHAFQREKHVLIEAGTGVGKSLGYLFPAAYFSRQEHKKPIVISTYTIQLQEQLLKKEIPLLAKLLPFNVDAVLLKGRSHYIDLEKFYQTLFDEEDNYDTTLTKMQILVWLTETETGEKDELNLSSGGLIFWEKIRSGPAVFSKKHDWLEKDFYLKAKKKAENADIIITNHPLLLTDLKENGSVLPEYNFVILDEGHHFEKTASQFFGASLDYFAIRLLMGKFGLVDQPHLFYELEEVIKTISDRMNGPFDSIKLNQLILDLTYEIDEFFKLVVLFAKRNLGAAERYYRAKVRFSKSAGGKEGRALFISAERISFLLKDIQTAIKERLDWITNEKKSLSTIQENKLEEIHLFLSELEELRKTVIDCFIKDSNDVKWIEIDLRSPQNVTTFVTRPLVVADKLKELFFSIKKSVVITSASLTVNQSFGYILKELGLNSETTEQLMITSPFDYKNQVKLLIPKDMPEINAVPLDEFVITLTEHIISLAEAAKGRMLLLFTAYDMLKKTYELIKESGFLHDYVIMAQGISSGSPARLTRNFKRYEKAILLGTSSFWEGVDIPGEDLSILCIVRLPFSPPDEPLTEAKSKLISMRGGNPFTEYSLPEAVLRFKQGFGRLIRTERDKGIVVVLDKRIITTKYGSSFLASIPPVSVQKGPIDELVNIIKTWV